jgi:very-short-patch-repair endonuclease
MQLRLVTDFAQSHHGLVHRRAALDRGISTSAWYRAIAADQVEQLFPNVVRLLGAPSTLEQRALAAVWACGKGAMASHRTSATLWGKPRPDDDPIDVLLVERARHSLPDGIVVHRPRDHFDLRPVIRRKVPTTNPLRMLVDLGAVDESDVYATLMHVLTSRIASPQAIHRALLRHSRKGRHGVVALRTALERWLEEELPPDSELEAALLRLVDDHGLPPVQFHATVAGFEVDFLVCGTNVVIECDGWGTHGMDRDQFEFDRIRNPAILAAGFHIIHVTWQQLTTDAAGTAERIRNVLRTWAPHALEPLSGRVSSRKPKRSSPGNRIGKDQPQKG